MTVVPSKNESHGFFFFNKSQTPVTVNGGVCWWWGYLHPARVATMQPSLPPENIWLLGELCDISLRHGPSLLVPVADLAELLPPLLFGLGATVACSQLWLCRYFCQNLLCVSPQTPSFTLFINSKISRPYFPRPRKYRRLFSEPAY